VPDKFTEQITNSEKNTKIQESDWVKTDNNKRFIIILKTKNNYDNNLFSTPVRDKVR
jgi:hypothetical protein